MELNLPVQIFNDSMKDLLFLKDNLSAIFQDIGHFIVHIANEVSSFKGKIIPYVEYFYPVHTDTSDNCFIKEIILPGRHEIDRAFIEVLSIMEKNKDSRETINANIERLTRFQNIIRKLLENFTGIKKSYEKYYSVNDKSEDTLFESPVHSQMDILFRQIDSISGQYEDLHKELSSSFNQFNNIQTEIDETYQTYINKLEKDINSSQSILTNELMKSSGEFNNMLKILDNIEEYIGNIINNLQMEDIGRQNLEKIIYFIEFAGEIADKYTVISADIRDEKIDEIVLYTSKKKIEEIKDVFIKLLSSLENCFKTITDNINNFNIVFGSSEKMDPDSLIKKFDDLCNKTNILEDDFISRISMLINKIKDLNELLYSFFIINKKFSNLFLQLSGHSVNLSIINESGTADLMLQSEIINLSSEIKKSIKESAGLLKEINFSIGTSIDEHHRNLMRQEETLQKIAFVIHKVSSRLKESRNYYRKMSDEIKKNSTDIVSFFEKEDKSLLNIRNAGNTMQTISTKLVEFITSANKKISFEADSYSAEIAIIKDVLAETGRRGDYKNLMLISLLKEYSGKLSDENIILF